MNDFLLPKPHFPTIHVGGRRVVSKSRLRLILGVMAGFELRLRLRVYAPHPNNYKQ